ncbi:g8861 [Coccomyxa viridis]|uniref:non-specific serine/threonine protein kinase n=1 Tax=Coccomyxa viridis TaxID=1274662 RepID=A0ABP1G1J3_9CHLO
MKLDVNALRYLSKEEYRVLQAIELGQKNHDIVPVPLIESLAKLRRGGIADCLKGVLRQKLVHHDNCKYEGYRLTTLGYDFLALKALLNRGAVSAVGQQIGVGKESDVFEVLDVKGERCALKLHRLGRTSFRAVKAKRDYLQHRSSFSWLYLSRLAAAREYAFMKALHAGGFPVPRPLDNNRHAVLMSLVDATPLYQVHDLQDVGGVYSQLMAVLSLLAERGLVHCDCNEFNVLVDEECKVTLIDFPQMVPTSHRNAQELFDRDVACITRFFSSKLKFISEGRCPDFKAIVRCANPDQALDIPLTAPGSRSPECDALSTYSMTDLAQHESSRSETDLERNTAEVWSGSKDTTYNC